MLKNRLTRISLTLATALFALTLTACTQTTADLSSPEHHNPPAATPSPQTAAHLENSATPAPKPDAQAPSSASISVSGVGQIKVDPDIAVLRIGAISQAKQPQTAQNSVNNTVKEILTSLENMGIGKKNLQTTNITLVPVYKNIKSKDGSSTTHQIIAYRASNTITAHIVHLERVGQVIAQAIDSGANNIQGLSYQLQDDSKAKANALKKAVDKAHQKAFAVASALGLDLGRVQQVQIGNTSANWFSPRHTSIRSFAARKEVSPAPVEPGQVKVTANVTIIYHLK